MTPKLTEELSHALAEQPGQPLQVEDPVSHKRYVDFQLHDYVALVAHGILDLQRLSRLFGEGVRELFGQFWSHTTIVPEWVPLREVVGKAVMVSLSGAI